MFDELHLKRPATGECPSRSFKATAAKNSAPHSRSQGGSFHMLINVRVVCKTRAHLNERFRDFMIKQYTNPRLLLLLLLPKRGTGFQDGDFHGDDRGQISGRRSLFCRRRDKQVSAVSAFCQLRQIRPTSLTQTDGASLSPTAACYVFNIQRSVVV